MIVSHEWIKAFVPHELSPQQVGDLLSRHTVTLDGIERTGGELAAIVVAQVVEAGMHPNSDHLWVTKVDDGSGTLLDVVCGAPVVKVGSKYPFARTGVTLPGGLRIEKRKIRGETSNGMLCSARELALGEDQSGILELTTDVPPGTPLLDVLPASDAKIDLDVLPNRPDLLSHIGVAREISALTGMPIRRVPHPDVGDFKLSIDLRVGGNHVVGTSASVRIQDTDSCPLYVALIVHGVKVGPSPEWLRKRLESIGHRSISNVVDVTNYVLHAFGQPVHAFDLSKLAGSSIVVRPTRAGETLVTLDGVTRELAPDTTVICDGERPVALAGVMGGRDSEVTDATTDILLEVALFDTRFVRRVRRAVGLSTDASYRFERGVDSGAVREIAFTAAALLAQVAGGVVTEGIIAGNEPAEPPSVILRVSRLGRLIGEPVSSAEIERILSSLGCGVQQLEADVMKVSPPSWRHDLGLEVDLIEEVARMRGFDALPDELRPTRPGTVPDHPLYSAGRRVRDVLVAAGLAETHPMPFTSIGNENSPRVRNPLADDEPFLRASLLDTLARRAEYNLSRMQGDVRLFEIGNAFVPSAGRLPVEQTRVAALIMGKRRPAHFTEPNPPAFDIWDARAIAESISRAAFPGEVVRFDGVEHEHAWTISTGSRGVVGTVGRVVVDRPVWASEAFGVELTLGTLASDDVAPLREHAHGSATADGASSRSFPRFKPLPSTPAAEFDLALIVPDGVRAAQVEESLKRAGGELLERLELFDEFRGAGVPDGSRSLAWRLTFRHPERTLRDKEIEGRRARLLEALNQELGIKPRAS